jgi:hypothetical protein
MSQVDSRGIFHFEQSITTERDLAFSAMSVGCIGVGPSTPLVYDTLFASDLPLNFHPAAIGASAGFTPSGAV